MRGFDFFVKRKISFGVLILAILIFAWNRDAYSDFGSFSGTSDYSSSRSSSHSDSSHSTSTRPSRTSTSTRTRERKTAPINLSSGTDNLGNVGLTAGTLGGSNDDDCGGVAFVFVIVLIFFIIISIRKKKHQDPVIININEPIRTLKPMEEYLELDPGFDEERIKDLISNLYVQMQDTWHAKDISSLRPYMTDKFYNQMDRQLEELRKSHRTDYTERIAVLSTDLRGWRQASGRDYITVGLNSRIVSYVLDDLTGELISGHKNKEKFMEYEIELTRKSGEVTKPEEEGIKTDRCPHCGAPLKLNASAKCEYCGSVITAVNSDWAISAMRGISQRTA